jgi:cytochrome c oxidase cbb3-type subunit 3
MKIQNNCVMKKIKLSFLFMLFTLLTSFLFGQDVQQGEVSPFASKYVTYFLIGGIIIEEILIIILAGIIVKAAKVTFNLRKTQKISTIAFLLLSSGSLLNAESGIGMSYELLNTILLWIAVILALVILAMVGLIAMFIYMMEPPKPKVEGELSGFAAWWEKINALVPKEKEKELLTDHDYDGIKELNNFMPPWLQYIFIGTIIWAPIYLWYYHGGGPGKLMEEEYYAEVKAANAELEKRMAQKGATEIIDENNVIISTDDKDIAEGKALFISKTCSSCHGENAQGAAVGPNLIDDYWLHGGTVQDIFKTIKYGKPDKGMPAWKESISGKQTMQIISFIKSQHGKSFPNAKEPQGKLFKEELKENETQKDSLSQNQAKS